MRRGYSLLEVLLVLAVLAVLAGLAVPALTSSLDGPRLRAGGEQIRTEWAKARNLAMKTGRIQVFRCKLSGDEYEVHPYYAADDALESSQVTSGGETAQPVASATVSKARRLPEGIVFAGGETLAESRAAAVDTVESGDWGQPILFYTDGTSSTARLSLTNRRKQAVSIELRGLTGTAQVSTIHGQEAVQ